MRIALWLPFSSRKVGRLASRKGGRRAGLLRDGERAREEEIDALAAELAAAGAGDGGEVLPAGDALL